MQLLHLIPKLALDFGGCVIRIDFCRWGSRHHPRRSRLGKGARGGGSSS
jgi:hypothetical protein